MHGTRNGLYFALLEVCGAVSAVSFAEDSKEVQLDFLKYYDGNINYEKYIYDINNNLNTCHSNWIEWCVEKYKRTYNIDYLLYCEKRMKVNKILNNRYQEVIYNLIQLT